MNKNKNKNQPLRRFNIGVASRNNEGEVQLTRIKDIAAVDLKHACAIWGRNEVGYNATTNTYFDQPVVDVGR
jgi:hypothetical protein